MEASGVDSVTIKCGPEVFVFIEKKNVAIIPMNFTAGCSEAILSFSFYVICALSVITIT